MKNKFIQFMISNIFTFAKSHIILSVSMLILLFTPPLYAKYSYSLETTNIIRDTQLLLSLNGIYIDPIDGKCNDKTKQALKESKLAKTRFDKSVDITCNTESLEVINNDLRSVLMADASVTHSTATHNQNDVNDTTSITPASRDINDIKASLRNTNSALKGITDGIATNFLNQYNSLASIGITIFIAAVSATIAIIALTSAILRDSINKRVEESHQKVLEEAKNKLLLEGNIMHTALFAEIYGRLGGQMINLYKDLGKPQNTHKPLYLSYVRLCADISKVGNDVANNLVELYGKQKTCIPDKHKQYIKFCRNNFVFYTSQANDRYLAVAPEIAHESENEVLERNEDDIKNVKRHIKELEKIADEEKIAAEQYMNNYWLDINDTIVWAKLCLGLLTAQQAKTALEQLMQDNDIGRQWKTALKKRYDLYDKFEEHRDKVNLQV